jgi:hypothetical protein
MGNLSVLDIYDLISNSEPDSVRWAKVKHFKLILINGAYSVPPQKLAARLIERMLQRDRSHLRRRHSKPSSKTDDTSGIGEARMMVRDRAQARSTLSSKD